MGAKSIIAPQVIENDPTDSSAALLEKYLTELREVRASGTGVPETSYYPALANLLNAVGEMLKPQVRCIIQTRDQGAGIPDGGLFTAEQFQRPTDPEPKAGQMPARGVIECKGTDIDVLSFAQSDQVQRYLRRYGIVLATNFREFFILERGADGKAVPRESFALADNEEDFWKNKAAHPRATARLFGRQCVEFLLRACLHAAPLVNPEDVAWFLASYARDGLCRVERLKDLPALLDLRHALEDALGIKFTDERGEHFFLSTLVQTLFYGVFSAWVSWHGSAAPRGTTFDWRTAEWCLHVPFIRTLYEEVAKPSRLGPLGLVEALDWAAGVLNRVDRREFFRRFQDEQAVQYFYEPFLEAYDPKLRKELGVWYTPPEIVKYQVARVDQVLREELDLPDGLADPNVIVLDPCCGTGTYLVEVLRRIADTLRERGGDALVASDLKRAAMRRVFGFEIMPAPFVVAHLQLGLMLQDQGVPLSHEKGERVGVYLTNALTGWEPRTGPKQRIFLPELEEEREAADQVKRAAKILVVLGNPPYNAFAGVSPAEERGLVETYKVGLRTPPEQGGWGIKKFNLDDLYIRFFRVAERRIAEMTGRGVVSFISNHSWISEPSFVVLRKHLLDSFDKFWIENLHGNRKISEYAPDGRTSETIFAIKGFSVGIRQGVATSLWVKTGKPKKRMAVVRFRDDIDAAKAEERRAQLLASLKRKRFNAAYTVVRPSPENRYSFRPENVAPHYTHWPKLVELCALPPSNGLMEKRGGALIDIDRQELEKRMWDYFDPTIDWKGYTLLHRALTQRKAAFEPEKTRLKALEAERYQPDRIVRYFVRPFEVRWCYYTNVSPVWNSSRPQLWAQCWPGNRFLVVRPFGVASPEGVPLMFTRLLGDNDALRGHAYYLPFQLSNGKRLNAGGQQTLFDIFGKTLAEDIPVANLSAAARAYLADLRIKDPDKDDRTAGLLWMHALAIGYSPAYLNENADGIRRDWPRIPLPATRELLEASAALGERVAALLDTEAEVPGVTCGKLAPLFRAVCVPARVGGGELDPNAGELSVTAGWGHIGRGGATMPAKGTYAERAYDSTETAAIKAAAQEHRLSVAEARRLLGDRTYDVYLNRVAYWRNVPKNVWNYHIGGYQVLKKWLSYRERAVLGRPLRPDEVREAASIARRLTALVLLQPAMDENYRGVKQAAIAWTSKAETNKPEQTK